MIFILLVVPESHYRAGRCTRYADERRIIRIGLGKATRQWSCVRIEHLKLTACVIDCPDRLQIKKSFCQFDRVKANADSRPESVEKRPDRSEQRYAPRRSMARITLNLSICSHHSTRI